MQVELRRLLKSLGATAVFVTHDQDEALTMSDKVAVMNAGRIEQYADPQGVYARPETLFTMRFVGISSELRRDGRARGTARSASIRRSDAIVAEGDQRVGARRSWSRRGPSTSRSNGRTARNDPARNSIEGRMRQIMFQGSRTRVAVDVGADCGFHRRNRRRQRTARRSATPVRADLAVQR